MQSLTWDEIIAIYSSRKDPNSADFAQAMVEISQQLQTELKDFPVRLNLMKNMLLLILEDMPETIPPGFPSAVGVYWVAPNSYSISIGFYESLDVPADKAIPTIKFQLSRAKQLAYEINLTAEEHQQWTEHYRSKLREDVAFLYSRQPTEWLITNLSHDIAYHLSRYLRTSSKIRHTVKMGEMDEAKANEAFEEFLKIYRHVTDILGVAEAIETERRSIAFLKEHFDSSDK